MEFPMFYYVNRPLLLHITGITYAELVSINICNLSTYYFIFVVDMSLIFRTVLGGTGRKVGCNEIISYGLA